jgi:RimJ/RimL family protein N-acetyltransferase
MAIKSKTFIRRAEREDLDTVVAWMESPDFLQFLYGDATRSPKQIREQIVAMMGRSAGNVLPGAIYLIIDSPDHGPLGLLSLQNISWRNRSCSIDLYLGDPKMRNHLTASMAFFLTMEYCFYELNLHRVCAYIYSFNTASWRVIEKIGAVREVTLRDHVARDGKLHDVYCYGLLRHEFEAFRKEQAGRGSEDLMRAMIEERRRASDAEPGDAEKAP